MSEEIRLTNDDLKEVCKMIVVQQAEVASLDKNNWRPYFESKGYGWLIEFAEEIFKTEIDTPDLDPETLGLDAGDGGWLLDILSCMHQEEQ